MVSEVSAQFSLWSDNNWIDIFLSPGINKSPSIFQELYMCTGEHLQHSAGVLFSLHFLLAQNVHFSKKLEFLRASWTCTQSWPYAWPHTCTWASRLLGICWGFSEPPMDISFQSIFFTLYASAQSIFLLSLNASGGCSVKQLPLIFSGGGQIHLGQRLFTLDELQVMSYKDILANKVFWGTTKQVKWWPIL